MDPLEGVDFGAARQTLVMALRQDCRFCQDSLPFYQQLVAAAGGRAAGALQLTVVSTDPSSSLSEYLGANGVVVDHVVAVQRGSLKIPGTPQLLLVDSGGLVTRLWRGRLGPDQEREVFRELGLIVAD
jgi:hypothetical protein